MTESATPEPAKKLTLSDVEDIVDKFAKQYAAEHYSLPARAIRIVLWPTDKFLTHVQRGPTAIIRMGILPGHKLFNEQLRNAIDFVYRKHLWESVEIELAAHITRRETGLRRFLREKYNFRTEMVPESLGDEEISIATITRVEVVHRETKLREVVEFESGKGFQHTAREVARDRLARRVHEMKMAQTDPMDLPSDHPDWVAKTN